MRLSHPQEQILIEHIEIEVDGNAQKFIEAIDVIRSKYPDIKMSDIEVYGTEDGEVFINYQRFQENPNYEAELKAYEEQERKAVDDLINVFSEFVLNNRQ